MSSDEEKDLQRQLLESIRALSVEMKRLADLSERPGRLTELEKWSLAISIAAAAQTDDVKLLQQKIRSLRALVPEFSEVNAEPR